MTCNFRAVGSSVPPLGWFITVQAMMSPDGHWAGSSVLGLLYQGLGKTIKYNSPRSKLPGTSRTAVPCIYTIADQTEAPANCRALRKRCRRCLISLNFQRRAPKATIQATQNIWLYLSGPTFYCACNHVCPRETSQESQQVNKSFSKERETNMIFQGLFQFKSFQQR